MGFSSHMDLDHLRLPSQKPGRNPIESRGRRLATSSHRGILYREPGAELVARAAIHAIRTANAKGFRKAGGEGWRADKHDPPVKITANSS